MKAPFFGSSYLKKKYLYLYFLRIFFETKKTNKKFYSFFFPPNDYSFSFKLLRIVLFFVKDFTKSLKKASFGRHQIVSRKVG